MADEDNARDPAAPKARRFRPAALADAANGSEALERLRTQLEDVQNSPGVKAMQEALERPSALQEALQGLNAFGGLPALEAAVQRLQALGDLPTLPPVHIPAFDRDLLLAPAPEVALLQQVHAELEGMAALLEESARQTTAMVEVTRGNLAALGTVATELQRSRESSDKASRALIGLTVALFVVGAVAAIAVVPDFVRQIIHAWAWVQSVR